MLLPVVNCAEHMPGLEGTLSYLCWWSRDDWLGTQALGAIRHSTYVEYAYAFLHYNVRMAFALYHATVFIITQNMYHSANVTRTGP